MQERWDISAIWQGYAGTEEYIGSEIEKLFGDICIVNEENQIYK